MFRLLTWNSSSIPLLSNYFDGVVLLENILEFLWVNIAIELLGIPWLLVLFQVRQFSKLIWASSHWLILLFFTILSWLMLPGTQLLIAPMFLMMHFTSFCIKFCPCAKEHFSDSVICAACLNLFSMCNFGVNLLVCIYLWNSAAVVLGWPKFKVFGSRSFINVKQYGHFVSEFRGRKRRWCADCTLFFCKNSVFLLFKEVQILNLQILGLLILRRIFTIKLVLNRNIWFDFRILNIGYFTDLIKINFQRIN